MVNLINEHFVTIWDNISEKEIHFEQVWNILINSYKDIGGLQGINKNRLMKPSIMWKLVRRNNKINAVCIYNTYNNCEYGRKMIACGCLNDPNAKLDLYKICSEDISQVKRGTWAEVSGAMEHIYICKLGGIPIPNNIAKNILQDLNINVDSLDSDNFHYTRTIGKLSVTKMLFGNIPEQYRTVNWDSDVDTYKNNYFKFNDKD